MAGDEREGNVAQSDSGSNRKIVLELGDDAARHVREMAGRLEVEGSADVVKSALSLLKFYLDKREQGFQFQVVSKEGMVSLFEIANLFE